MHDFAGSMQGRQLTAQLWTAQRLKTVRLSWEHADLLTSQAAKVCLQSLWLSGRYSGGGTAQRRSATGEGPPPTCVCEACCGCEVCCERRSGGGG